jgi:hypothetical protein
MAVGLTEYLPQEFKDFADVFSLLSLDFVKVGFVSIPWREYAVIYVVISTYVVYRFVVSAM